MEVTPSVSGEAQDIDWVTGPSIEYFKHEFGPEVCLDSSRDVRYKITNQCMVTIAVPMKNIEQVRRAVLKYLGGPSKFLSLIIHMCV